MLRKSKSTGDTTQWEKLKQVGGKKGDKACVICGAPATRVLKFSDPKNNVYSCEEC